jgi:DNA-binding PucR family transcriptional regulator
MSANTNSSNPVVQAIAAGTAPQMARLMAARGLLPLAADELLEVLVTLRADEDQEVVEAAAETLEAQPAETLLAVASASETSPTVLSYLASRADAQREIYEAVVLNAGTPDEAVAALASGTSDGSLLELISINQQRLIRAPAIIEALLGNPARTNEAERRAQETRREFFEKERGAQQIADEMRARGMGAAAEFLETAESIGDGGDLTYDDAWLLAAHIEVSTPTLTIHGCPPNGWRSCSRRAMSSAPPTSNASSRRRLPNSARSPRNASR